MKIYSRVLPGKDRVFVLHINVNFNKKRQVVLAVLFDPYGDREGTEKDDFVAEHGEIFGAMFKNLEEKLRDELIPKLKKGKTPGSLTSYIYRTVKPFLEMDGVFLFFLCDNYGNAVKYDNKLSYLCYYGIEFDKVYSFSSEAECLRFEPGCMVLISQKDLCKTEEVIKNGRIAISRFFRKYL